MLYFESENELTFYNLEACYCLFLVTYIEWGKPAAHVICGFYGPEWIGILANQKMSIYRLYNKLPCSSLTGIDSSQ